MTNEQYMAAQMALVKASSLLIGYDWDEFLKRITTAETMGPIMDPTKFRLAQDNLRGIKRLAETAREMKNANQELFKSVVETQMAMGGDGFAAQAIFGREPKLPTGEA